MMNSHTALGIAQIVFYVPAVPFAIWLMTRNGKLRPRMAWYPFIPFTMIRLAGGALVIALIEGNPRSVGLATATIVLLNVGVVPLIIAALGFLRIIGMDNFKPTSRAKRVYGLLRFAIFVAVGLLSAGGGLASQPEDSLRSTGRGLLLAGYVVFTVELVTITMGAMYFLQKRFALVHSSQKVIRGILFASPFLLVRTIYGLLQAKAQSNLSSKWNSLYGSPVAFALMALLMEYIAMLSFFFVGMAIPADRGISNDQREVQGSNI